MQPIAFKGKGLEGIAGTWRIINAKKFEYGD